MELAFASLHQLCAPLLDRTGELPAPQRRALETVFGLSDGAAPDRFLVGLGVLSLSAVEAEERPLLCVVDDAQWLDRASALTLGLVARRLLAERVGLVFAAREPGPELRHMDGLDVCGLRNDDARALLRSTLRFKLDEPVFGRIIAEMREHVVLEQAGGSIALRFHARDVHLVLAAGAGDQIPFRVLLDGEAPGPSAGVDVDGYGNGVLRDGRLYQLVRQHDGVRERALEIIFSESGAEAYAFTFG